MLTRSYHVLFMQLRFAYIILFLLVVQIMDAQTESDSTENRITVENADNLKGKRKGNSFVRYLNGNVRLFQDSIFMYCDTAILDEDQLIAYGNVVIVQHDTIKIFGDSLHYLSKSQQANLYGNIVLENGDQRLFTDTLYYDAMEKIARYENGANLIAGKTSLKSKRGIYLVEKDLINFYEQVSVQDSALYLYADSLAFLTESNRSIFKGPTRIDLDTSRIYCEAGFYDMDDELAVFKKNAQYKDGEKIAKADRIYYDRKAHLIELTGRADYFEPERQARGDTIRFNELSGDKEIIGFAYYKDTEREIQSNKIVHDAETGLFRSAGRTALVQDEMVFEADDLRYNEGTGEGAAIGDVIWQDTSANTHIICDSMLFRKSDEFVKAIGNERQPMLFTVQEGDTMFISADTLFNGQVSKTDSTIVMRAFHRVQVYKSDLQAVCDSLVYAKSDSLMHFFGDPFMWSDSTQFSGDTIELLFAADRIDEMRIPSNGFIIQSLQKLIFNQIKGRQVRASFFNGDVDSLTVMGNAESIYFLQDDTEAFIGMNKTICSKILFEFSDGQISDIRFYTTPTSVLTPMQRVVLSKSKLEGFNWNTDKRPLSREDLRLPFILDFPKSTELIIPENMLK